MFARLRAWWRGEDISVRVVALRHKRDFEYFEHTIVRCPDDKVWYVMGYRGKPGEVFTVNTRELWTFD